MMLFRALTWQIGIKNFVLHPMRSLLTVLGIFIGVASVIWLLAIGEGISVKAKIRSPVSARTTSSFARSSRPNKRRSATTASPRMV